jgi:tetratricopeptide (TPR) repeat protein
MLAWVFCALLAGCYSSQPAPGGYVPKTHAAQKHADAVESLKSNRLEEALGEIDEAVQGDPDYADAAMTRALILLRLARLDDAAVAYDAVRRKWPDRAEAHALAGILREKSGKSDAAKPCYAAAKAAYEQRVAAGDRTPGTQLSRTLATYLLDGRSAGLVEINKLLGEFPDYGPALEIKVKIAENNRAFLLEWMEQPGK